LPSAALLDGKPRQQKRQCLANESPRYGAAVNVAHESPFVLAFFAEIWQGIGMPNPTAGPPNDVLFDLVNYDPETGVFTRKKRLGKGCVGDVLATLRPDGYLKTCLLYKSYLLHRLAFQYMTGKAPAQYIDHINGDKTDNRWANLREASPLLSSQNKRRANKGSLSRFIGVTKTDPNGRWVASIGHNYKTYNLGTYETEEEAHQVYLAAKRRIHAGCTI
jgi:hypothetical protein